MFLVSDSFSNNNNDIDSNTNDNNDKKCKTGKIEKKLIAFNYFIIDTFAINDFYWY